MSYESYWDCLPNDVIKIIKEYSVHPIINVINEYEISLDNKGNHKLPDDLN